MMVNSTPVQLSSWNLSHQARHLTTQSIYRMNCSAFILTVREAVGSDRKVPCAPTNSDDGPRRPPAYVPYLATVSDDGPRRPPAYAPVVIGRGQQKCSVEYWKVEKLRNNGKQFYILPPLRHNAPPTICDTYRHITT